MSDIALELARRFAALPPAQRERFVAQLAEKGWDFRRLPLVKFPVDERAPLTLAQRRLWFLWKMAPQSHAYNLSGALRWRGILDRTALANALTQLRARHSALCTRFVARADGDVEQFVETCDELSLQIEDASDLPAALNIAEQNARKPFDLELEQPLRIGLIDIADDDHVLWLSVHHIVADGWSMQCVLDDLLDFYRAQTAGTPLISADELCYRGLTYRDYACWQRYALTPAELQRQLDYWLRLHAGEAEPLVLPSDRQRPPVQALRGARHAFCIEAEIAAQVRAHARSSGVTLFAWLLTAYQILLYRLSGQRDLRIGIVNAGRDRPETEKIVGFFAATQVLRLPIDGSRHFEDLLQAARSAADGAQANADLPFDRLIEALAPARDLSRNPLFQAKFTQQIALPARIDLADVRVDVLALADEATHFDLGLDITDRGDRIDALFTYDVDLFDAGTVASWAAHLCAATAYFSKRPQARVADWQMAPEKTHRTEILRPRWASVLDAWHLALRAKPDAASLRCEDKLWSRADVDAAAGALAQTLRARGVRAGDRVAVCTTRSEALVIGILAAWKAGAVYVPLDTKQPGERLRWLIDDVKAVLVIVDDEGAAALRDSDATRLRFDEGEAVAEALLPSISAQWPAYIIYTSGSTGRPKGVAITHAALAHYVDGVLQRLHAEPAASFAMISTVAADLGHTTLFGALADGRLLHLIAAERAFDPDRFAEYMAAHRVDVLKIVPSHLQGLLHAEKAADVLPRQALIVGGETIAPKLLQHIRKLAPACRIVNHYGPTETTVGVLTDEDAHAEILSLGRPLPAAETWILDADLNPVPTGVVGELYIGGPQLARGYIGRAALTAERFVPHPFAVGQRLYRSGDNAKQLPDGRIVYLGRRDDQVKIRGYRVELREIAAQLLRHGADEAQVQLRDIDGHAQLMAWVTPATADAAVLRDALANTLPDYMVPAHILPLPAMPLTANGKSDRAALPLPLRAANKNAAPVNPIEKILLTVWQSVLKRDAIGVDDNFFELGGDSILSLQVISRARKAGLKLIPRQLFEKQTIAELARVAQPMAVVASSSTQTAPVASAAFALTPIQRHFFDLDIPNRNHWNQSVLLRPRVALDAQRVEKALRALARHHAALRTHFRQNNSVWQQQVGEAAVQFIYRRLDDPSQLPMSCEGVQRSLDVSTGRLLAALLAELPDGTQRLMICVHHLAIDGVSWRILLDDFSALYRQRELPETSLNFAAWSAHLQALAGADSTRAEMDFWRRAIAADASVSAARIGDARTHAFVLPAALTQRLQTSARSLHDARGDELLIAALVHALREPTTIWLEHHGRDRDDIDTSRCIGWFTTIYPIALQAAETLPATVASVRDALRAVPRGGVGFGLLRHLANETTLQAAAPAIVFNHLGSFDAQFDADALFDLATENTGAERDPDGPMAPLTIVSREVNGELRCAWSYSDRHYDAGTVAALAQRYVNALTAIAQTEAMPARSYPASAIQQGLLFHAQLAPQSTAYINQLAVTFTDLEAQRFADAWRCALERHDILRTTFAGAGGDARQNVWHRVDLPLRILDWRDRPQRAAQLAAEEMARGFDVTAAPLMRLVLIHLNERETRFIWTRHHLLLDGWSTARLLAEVLGDYANKGQADKDHAGHRYAAPRRSYGDFVEWQRSRDRDGERDFWQRQLRDFDAPTLLAAALPKQAAAAGYGLHATTLAADRTQHLQRFARAQHVTLNTLLQAAWAVLLGRYCGQRTVCLGVTVAGRPAELDGIDEVLGLFINTLPLICPLDPALPAADFLRRVQMRNADIREFEQMPLAQLQQMAGGDMFDTLLVFENFPLAGDDAHTLSHRDVDVVEATHYALTLVIEPGDQLTLRFGYDRERMDAGSVQRIAEHMAFLLDVMTSDPGTCLGALALPPPPPAWNATRCDWGGVVPVHEAIRRRALHAPRAIALAMGNRTLSYAELDAAADAWAQRLCENGAGPERIVAIAAERSFELVIGLLAILKSGAAYLPIDPDYPADRIDYMLDDAKPALLLTQEKLRGRFHGLPVLSLNDTAAPANMASRAIHGDQLAYLIYTSGSTGRPKGAGNTHAALHNRLAWMQAAYPIGAGCAVLQKTPISFDVSVWEFFWPLISGATLVLAAPDAHRDPQQLIDTICTHHIDTLHFVPSMLQALLLHPEVERCASLRQIICSGEALPPHVQDELLARLPQARLFNLYGPTEAAIDVTHWTCARGDASVPIGAPIANTQIHVLDADLNALPAGIAGELYIGGANLARGYRGRAALTAERFVANPFAAGERLYRTGDLARWRDDGVVEYLGRLDHQIKLRGQRIELGEIETAMRACDGVRDAVVVAYGQAAAMQLAGYVVAHDDVSLPDLRRALQKCLPDYMVPSTLTRLDALPLSPNGKLDRKALPPPQIDVRPWQAPQGPLENLLAAHWRAALGCARVGRQDQFFALGGHSLLAAQLVARLRGELGVTVPLKLLFDAPVLADFAHAIAGLQNAALDADKIDALDELLSGLEV